MATTANGYPHPVGSDAVRDGDNAIKALADTLDLKFAMGTRFMQVGTGVYSTDTNGGIAITLPRATTQSRMVFALDGDASVNNTNYFGVSNSAPANQIWVTVRKHTGALAPSAAVRLHWMVIG